jgi:uncharacterized protein YodC (DUF2158 family)
LNPSEREIELGSGEIELNSWSGDVDLATDIIEAKFHFRYGLNQRVFVGGDVPARVVSICVKLNGELSYQCRWWDGRSTKEDWFTTHEIAPREAP